MTGYYADPDAERLDILDALRSVVLGDDRYVLSRDDCARLIAQSDNHVDLLAALVGFFNREPTEATG